MFRKIILCVISTFPLFSCVGFHTDSVMKQLIDDFEKAGVDLRVDRDQIIRTDIKAFSGFVEDEDSAYRCGIRAPNEGKLQEGTMVFFHRLSDGTLKQVYLGHVMLKRRYRLQFPEDRPFSRVILTAGQAKKGATLCSKPVNSVSE